MTIYFVHFRIQILVKNERIIAFIVSIFVRNEKLKQYFCLTAILVEDGAAFHVQYDQTGVASAQIVHSTASFWLDWMDL